MDNRQQQDLNYSSVNHAKVTKQIPATDKHPKKSNRMRDLNLNLNSEESPSRYAAHNENVYQTISGYRTTKPANAH